MGNLERDPALFQMQEGDLVKMADSLRPASRMVALREDTSEPRLCGNCAGTPSKRRRSLPRGGLGMPEFLRLLSAGVGCSRGLACVHYPKVAGSNPAPATNYSNQGLRARL